MLPLRLLQQTLLRPKGQGFCMKKLLLPLLVFAFSALAFAGSQTTFTINFEQYPEYTQITNQYAGQYATFTNALQLVAPYYDYFDYPPTPAMGSSPTIPTTPSR